MSNSSNYIQYMDRVPSSGILSVDNLGGKNNVVSITNVGNALKTPGNSESLLVKLTVYPTAGISSKEVKATAGVTRSYGSPAANGIVYATAPLTVYPIMNQMGISIINQALTLTLSATSSLPVGGWVMLSSFNDAAKALRCFSGEPLAIVRKIDATTYSLGKIVPVGFAAITDGKCNVAFIGMSLPTQSAHACLVGSRIGSAVSLTCSISEVAYLMSGINQDKYSFIVSANVPFIKDKTTERHILQVTSISTDGTGTVWVDDPNSVIDETFISTAGTERVGIEIGGSVIKKTSLDTSVIYFTNLTQNDNYIVEVLY